MTLYFQVKELDKSEFEYRKSGQSYKTNRLKCEYEIVIFSNVL